MHARRPGPGHTCRVAGREYVVEYTANRAGLRDSDHALSGAEIVVLGDSHGMGWGVRGEQSFPKRLQEITGRRVLNASMSSYGTAREMTLLERLALPAGTLVIQYSDTTSWRTSLTSTTARWTSSRNGNTGRWSESMASPRATTLSSMRSVS